jgi:hypothetical protein
MIRFSHRDRRVDRTVHRALGAMILAVGMLGTLAFLSPSPLSGLFALLGLGAVGGVYLVGAGRVLAEYRGDLRRVHGGGTVDGLLRAEVESEVGLDRPVGLPSQRSPLVRGAPGRPDSPTQGTETGD